MTDLISTIKILRPSAQVSVNAEDINQITWHDGNPTNITNQQITDKIAELEQAEVDNKSAKEAKLASGKAKLKSGDALTDAEISALFGD